MLTLCRANKNCRDAITRALPEIRSGGMNTLLRRSLKTRRAQTTTAT